MGFLVDLLFGIVSVFLTLLFMRLVVAVLLFAGAAFYLGLLQLPGG